MSAVIYLDLSQMLFLEVENPITEVDKLWRKHQWLLR